MSINIDKTQLYEVYFVAMNAHPSNDRFNSYCKRGLFDRAFDFH